MSLSQEIKELSIKVEFEMLAQINKFGDQRHPSFKSYLDGDVIAPELRAQHYGMPHESEARDDCERAFAEGRPTYAHVFLEEVSEAIGAATDADLEKELIQVAAVALNWIRAIRHNRANPTTGATA